MVWFPHDNHPDLLKELAWESGNPRWVLHGTPASGAGVMGLMEMGTSVVACCEDAHHENNFRIALKERAVEALLAGSQVFKDEDLQARAVGLCPSMGENKDKKAEKNEKRDEKVEKADEKVEKVEKADNKKDKKAEKNEKRDEKDSKIKGKKIKKHTKSKKGSKTPTSKKHKGKTCEKESKGIRTETSDADSLFGSGSIGSESEISDNSVS